MGFAEGADYLFAVKGNCPETFAVLEELDWDAVEYPVGLP